MNESYEALTVKSEDGILGVNIDMDELYKAYENGHDYDQLVDRAVTRAGAALENHPDFSLETLQAYDHIIEKSRGMIENAMNGVTSDLTITPRVMAAQGGYSGSASLSGDLISGINTALNTALAGGSAAGDIVIPVYIGGDMIDEIVVTAQQRMNLRSGGR